jgi:hypothetical protein
LICLAGIPYRFGSLKACPIRARYGNASRKSTTCNPIPYKEVASWAFGDAIFGTEYDNITSTIKIRRAGFPDCIDTEEMFIKFFDDLRRMRVIP